MKKLPSYRLHAFRLQDGRRYYCDQKMLLGSANSPASITKMWRHRQCTAEHLIARKDGGKDVRENIVAACRYCNAQRHRRKRDVSPEVFRGFVRRRIAKGKWLRFL